MRPRHRLDLTPFVVDAEDPGVGTTTFARTPPHLSAAPEIRTEPAPNLGQHTREILEELLSDLSAEVDELIEAGVVS